MKINQIKKNCDFCHKEFMARNLKHRPGKFCSLDCQRKGRKRETKMIHSTCQLCNKEFSQPKWWKSPAKFCSILCMSKVRGKNMRGENHPSWKGGDNRTGSHAICKKIKKDVGMCQKCFSTSSLHVHHKIKISIRPDLSADPANIEILCNKCHANEHPEYEGMILKKKNRFPISCQWCNEEFYVIKSKMQQKFCGLQCSIKNAKKIYMDKHGK